MLKCYLKLLIAPLQFSQHQAYKNHQPIMPKVHHSCDIEVIKLYGYAQLTYPPPPALP